jgi:hypothetical protein
MNLTFFWFNHDDSLLQWLRVCSNRNNFIQPDFYIQRASETVIFNI